ncbi:transmembrane protein 231-like [Sipha flava]|uniref:Transmembrane protein 231 n=1 Tax=Sipha flava TaxID=143950 RepID=A0A2S2Q555_9HEMI|nr:transmembrane protein 231-like [Sipha flava]
MSVHVVYSKSYGVQYKASICSKAFILYVVIMLLTFFLPFLFCYRSNGLWLKYEKYREQPRVRFKMQYLLYVETSDPMFPLICGNFPQTLKTTGFCSIIKVIENDIDIDGKKEFLDLELHLTTNETLDVHSVTLLLIFDFKIQDLCLFEMESMIAITHSSGLPGGRLDVFGDLDLVQKIPLVCSQKKPIRIHKPILLFESSDWLVNIYEKYSKQTISTKLDNMLVKWTRGRSYQQPFLIKTKINYKQVEILYKPKFWQVMKWAWIQYFSILVLSVFIFKKVKRFLFTKHIVNTKIERSI